MNSRNLRILWVLNHDYKFILKWTSMWRWKYSLVKVMERAVSQNSHVMYIHCKTSNANHIYQSTISWGNIVPVPTKNYAGNTFYVCCVCCLEEEHVGWLLHVSIFIPVMIRIQEGRSSLLWKNLAGEGRWPTPQKQVTWAKTEVSSSWNMFGSTQTVRTALAI